MSALSSIGQALGGLLGSSSEDADAKGAALQAAITSGGLQAAANYGAAGQAMQARANTLSGSHVAYDPTAVNADSAALAPVAAHYLSQFQNGGLAAQAAVAAQQQARGLNAQGGMAGIRSDTLNSGATQGQVGQVAQSEISQAGDAVNKLDAQKAAIALQKAVFAAQVSHANIMNSLNANQVSFDLGNTQQQLDNEATQATNNLTNSAASTAIDQSKSEGELGSLILSGLLAGTGAGVGAAASMEPEAETGLSTSAPLTAQTTSYTPTGYALPSVQVGATPSFATSKAVVPAYQPLFSTPPTLPTTPDFFNRGST